VFDTDSAARSATPAALRPGPAALLVGLVAIALMAAMPTKPLFSDNQNTKFLYGLAKAGYGRLQEDWLIGQGSNLPIFDGLVFFTRHFLGSWFFYVWQFATTTAYAAALCAVAWLTMPDRLRARPLLFWLPFGVLLAALHSNAGTQRLFEGAAHQYVLSWVFEPASVGVLALLAVPLFRMGQIGWAAVLVVAAAWMHPVYAIPGLFLLSGMLVAHVRFRLPLPWLILAAGAVGCLGAAAFTYSLLFPTDPAVQAEAVRIITERRIPEHSLPEVWFDIDAMAKCLVVGLAVWLLRRDPLGWLLGVVALEIAASALWVLVTRDLSLALAAPWRASSVIVPIADAVLLTRLAGLVAERLGRRRDAVRRAAIGSAVLVAAAVAVGVANRMRNPSWHKPAYLAWVRANAAPGDLYLTPIGENDFRLATGQPQYATWKTHPHRGQSVLDWYARVQRTRAVTGRQRPDCTALESLAAEGVTHLLRHAHDEPVACSGWSQVYADRAYRLWRWGSTNR
jgi:hypothetical protein